MEFINGIELFTAIREIGLLSIEEARFYTANILHALEKFHENSIIYRDLKP
jgi:cGMP-dependent protein kinase